MKLFVLFLLLNLGATAQKKWTQITRNDICVYAFMAVSGAADGLNQAISHHDFGIGNQFWDYRHSWKNKYKDWDGGDKRPAFFGSKTIFVCFTDGFHLSRTIDRAFTLAAVCISAGDLKEYKKKDRWKVITKKAIISTLVNRITFVIVFNNLHGSY